MTQKSSTYGAALDFSVRYFDELAKVVHEMPKDQVARFVSWIVEAREQGKAIFVLGNGGSATTASHFATDMGKGASLDRRVRFRILSLTDNVGWMTALGNDLSYEDVFVEQLKNFAEAGDIVVAISVSGNSPNVVKAVEWSASHGCKTVGLLGKDGGRLKDLVDLAIRVPTNHFGRAEDLHLIITHIAGYFVMET